MSVGGCSFTDSDMLVLDMYKCLKLAFSPFDNHSFTQLVSAIAALEHSLHALRDYYTSRINKDPILEAWPWCTTVGDYSLKYVARMHSSKLVFSATAVRDKVQLPVVVKFTQCYSVVAHNACVSAPKLLATINVC
jgi:hypothetical protein